jgi:hypothetical protein
MDPPPLAQNTEQSASCEDACPCVLTRMNIFLHHIIQQQECISSKTSLCVATKHCCPRNYIPSGNSVKHLPSEVQVSQAGADVVTGEEEKLVPAGTREAVDGSVLQVRPIQP